MQTRTRFIYSKRYGACFVPHIALAQMFSRSASRAGLKLIMTQGFSPRAKLSFAPEIPAGVVALNEPVDMYFEAVPDNVVDLMNNSLPEGFNVSRVIFPSDDSPSLGKVCKHVEYLLRLTAPCEEAATPPSFHDTSPCEGTATPPSNKLSTSPCEGAARKFYKDSILKIENVNGWTKIILKDPAQNPIGGFVKFMINGNFITGWQDINIVRTSIGLYDKNKGCVSL